jgi:hypothetical protein
MGMPRGGMWAERTGCMGCMAVWQACLQKASGNLLHTGARSPQNLMTCLIQPQHASDLAGARVAETRISPWKRDVS